MNRMIFKRLSESARRIAVKIDKYSPYPFLYPIVLSDSEKELFDSAVEGAKKCLEFGLGGSTIRTLQKSNAHITSVETDLDWICRMREYRYLRKSELNRLEIFQIDIGKSGKWGYPETENDGSKFPDYSSKVFEKIDPSEVDLVYVDGRFRAACVLKTIEKCCNNNLRILIHDFWSREFYHFLLDHIEMVERSGTLGLFKVGENVELEKIRDLYEHYKYDPR